MIFVFNEKNIHNHKIKVINHEKIRGLILYHIQIICSQNSAIVNKNHRTNSHDEKVHMISNILLFQWYIIVEIMIMEIMVAIVIEIRFGVPVSNM